MAVVNRYSRPIQYSTYNPRSLQELMIVPSYMRQQHDALDLGRMELDSKLAQVSGLDVHNERLKEQQDLLNQQSQAIAEQLQREGFNSSNKSAFMRFNKDYQNAIGPNGEIGKILAAKEAYAKNYKEFIDNAPKEWSQADLLRNWNKFKGDYTGFDEEGNIINIGQLGAPERVKYEDKLKAAKDLLGEEVVNHLVSGKYHFEEQADGSLGVVNKSGTLIETSNKNNIAAAREMLYGELNDPNSAWRKSIAFEGTDPNQVLNQVNLGLRSMFKNNVKDNRSQSYSQIRSADDRVNSSSGLTVSSESYSPSKYIDLKYTDIDKKLEQLSSIPTSDLSKEQRQELAGLELFKDNLEQDLLENEEYRNKKAELDRLTQEYNKVIRNSSDDNYGSYDSNNTYRIPTDDEIDNIPKNSNSIVYDKVKEKELLDKIVELRSDINTITKPAIESNKLRTTSYDITPTTSKDITNANTLNTNIQKLLSNNPMALYNSGTILDKIEDDGYKQLSDNEKQDISRLFYTAKPGEVKATGWTASGQLGLPEYTLRLEANDNREEPIQVRVAFDENSNGIVKDINGLAQTYVANSGPDGQQLVQAMEINRNIGMYKGYTWGELEDNNIVQNNPVMRTVKNEKMIQKWNMMKSKDSTLTGYLSDNPKYIKIIDTQLQNEKVNY